MKRQRVLVVEDEASMRDVYRRFFDTMLREEFEADIVPDAEQALVALREAPIDLMVLDWNLPGISGVNLAKALRTDPKTQAMGILMVTGKTTLGEEIVALDSGADDHLAKPFDEKILQARLRSLSRRRDNSLSRDQSTRFPGLDLDWETGRLNIDGRPVHLTPKEAELLRIFLHRPHVLHSHMYLWQALWGYDSDQWDHILVTTVSQLRKKLGPKWSERLNTHVGKGYSFDT
ncbi:MAG: response regulator transcription factor [Elusimicrobiota bacterium]